MRLAALPLPLLLAALPAQTRFAELGVRDHLPLERFEVVDLASGDLDGDRAPDVAILEPGRVRLLRNDGHAVFTPLGTFDIAPRGRFGAIALFDLEADGDRDVLFVLMDAASGILRNDPGGFVQIASPVTGPVRELAVGDVDRDGDDDVFAAMSHPPLAAGTGAPRSRLFRNVGGTLVDVTATHLPVEDKNASCAAFVDVDSDRDLDLVVGMAAHYLGPPSDNELWRNDGTGRFTRDVGALPFDILDDRELAFGDVDLDGDQDLVVARGSDYRPATLFRNTGSGSFVRDDAATPPVPTGSAETLVLADLDGDHDLDLAIGMRGVENGLELLRNDGSGTFSRWRRLAVGDGANRLVAFDADRDGRTDLLLGNRLAEGIVQRARLLLGRGTDLVDATEPIVLGRSELSFGIQTFRFSDLDHDGDLDMLLYGPHTAPLRVLHGDGDRPRHDVTASVLPPLVGHNRGFCIVDLDGDGADDVMIALQDHGTTDMHWHLLVGGPNGVLTELPAAAFPARSSYLMAAVAADLDGDGLQDLCLRDGYGFSTWRGTGFHRWQEDTRSTFTPGTGAFALGDLDRDGDLDLVTQPGAHHGTDRLHVRRNAGDGTFGPAVELPLPAWATFGSLVLADADRDLDLDLFVLATLPALFLNDGLGGFTLAPAADFPLPAPFARNHTVVDVDLDGDLDVCGIARSTSGVSHLELFTNDGAGRFTDAAGSAFDDPRLDAPWSFAVGDVDTDGDPDLVVEEAQSGVRVLSNLHRQTRVPWLARRGHPFRVSVGGPVGETVLVCFALGPGRWSFGGQGLLLLDPATLSASLPFALPAPGGIAFDLVLPDDPVLLGVELHAQAFHFATEPHFGNHAASNATY